MVEIFGIVAMDRLSLRGADQLCVIIEIAVNFGLIDCWVTLLRQRYRYCAHNVYTNNRANVLRKS